ncbi:hypothetical protein D3C85_1218190 [compost metagenome]
MGYSKMPFRKVGRGLEINSNLRSLGGVGGVVVGKNITSSVVISAHKMPRYSGMDCLGRPRAALLRGRFPADAPSVRTGVNNSTAHYVTVRRMASGMSL